MRTKSILAALLLMVAGMQSAQAQYDMKVWRNGAFTQYFVNDVDSVSYSKLVQSIQLTPEAIEIEVGQTCQLNVTVLPEDADDKTLDWQHSAIVSVSPTGLVTGLIKGTGSIRCYATDGSGVYAECPVMVTKPAGGDPEKHEYVDLGLPSGTLWATCNVGANNPEEFGGYYAWGETSTKDYYGCPLREDWSHYLWFDTETGLFTKYNDVDGQIELLPEDDAATSNWGDDWQMPSLEQLEELLNTDNTTSEYTELNDVNGLLITSNSNQNAIFLPAASYWYDMFWNDNTCVYRTRTLTYVGSPSSYVFYSGGGPLEILAGEYRYTGFSVRPVRKQ